MKRQMKCSVCGDYAGKYEQHPNRDTGWGLCRRCADWLEAKGYDEKEMKELYGTPGIHYQPKDA